MARRSLRGCWMYNLCVLFVCCFFSCRCAFTFIHFFWRVGEPFLSFKFSSVDVFLLHYRIVIIDYIDTKFVGLYVCMRFLWVFLLLLLLVVYV